MTETFSSENSVGIVSSSTLHFDQPLELDCGQQLENYQLVYESYGELNKDRSNAVLICHALSSNHHAAGYHDPQDRKPGWWDQFIGPGKPIDTRHFHVVCMNNIGGCSGSTGPASIHPATGKPYGPDFPPLRIRDWVRAQARLGERLGIQRWAAVIGGSLGGMQAMRWSLELPEQLRHCIIIASAMRLSAQNIAFNEIARQAIIADPDFHEGRYQEHGVHPRKGLTIARMIGHTTYLSDLAMGRKFGRELLSGSFDRGLYQEVVFQVESYLRHQGAVFADGFDANTYLLALRALDYFDLAREYGNDPVAAFSHAQCQFMVISFTSDWRFSPRRSQEIVQALIDARKPVSYAAIEAEQGHDAFLLPIPRYPQVLGAYMNRIHRES